MFKNNWTLTCVCDVCNQFFCRELDLPLARDSVEAYLRVEHGVRPATAASAFLNRRMKATLNVPGPFHRARVVMKPTENGDQMVPVPPAQIGVRRPGDADWLFVPEAELSVEVISQFEGSCEMNLMGSRGDHQRLLDRLAALGVGCHEVTRLLDQPISQGGTIMVEHEFLVDTTLRRAAAKIGFNDAAKVLGAPIVRRPDFDPVRRFVRLGEEQEPLVSANRLSILVGPDAATTKTHTCGLGWNAERRELIGVVGLFNEVTYGIRMCPGESEEWSSVASRHLFDPITHSISECGIAE
jgi:hypothetical protein